MVKDSEHQQGFSDKNLQGQSKFFSRWVNQEKKSEVVTLKPWN